MYRRNIFHILYPVACLIGLFIVYQAWFKPTYLPTPPPSQPNAVLEDSRGRDRQNRIMMAHWNWSLNRLA